MRRFPVDTAASDHPGRHLTHKSVIKATFMEAGRSPGHGTPHQAHTHAAGAGISLDQRQRPPAVRAGLRVVDPPDRGHADRAEVRSQPGPHRRWQIAGPPGPDATEATAARLPARSAGDRALAARDLSKHCGGGAAKRGRRVLLGRIGIPGRHRARQDLGAQRQDPRHPAPRATPVDLGGLGSQRQRWLLVCNLPRCVLISDKPQPPE